MGLFENFPYTNLHDLNLDWILGEVKKLLETQGYSPDNPPPYPVTSVNGQTGAVILFNEQEGAYIRFPDSENNQWNIYRLVNGVEAGIQFSATLPAKRMQGANRFAIYDEGNQPPYPVVSVNGKTGAVVLFNDQEGAYIRFPDSENTQWNVYRIIDGQANGIQFQKNGPAVRMQGDSRFQIYDAGNPPPYPVTSVNGQTGAAETPFTDHTDDVLEFVAGAVGASWGLKRTINTGSDTDEAEVEFTLQLNDTTGAPEAYIASGETVKKLLTEDDIPSSSGVVSVNGLTGVVLVNGANTPMQPGESQTVSQAIAAEAQARQQAIAAETQARQQAIAAETQARQQADTSLNDNIAKLRKGLSYVEDGTTIAANAAYTAGKFICWQGEMYRIKATINATVTSGNWTTYLDKMDGMGGALSQINADLTSLNGRLIKTATMTGTTSGGGNVAVNKGYNQIILLGAYCTNNDYMLIPWVRPLSNTIYLRALEEVNQQLALVTNESIDIVYMYIDK